MGCEGMQQTDGERPAACDAAVRPENESLIGRPDRIARLEDQSDAPPKSWSRLHVCAWTICIILAAVLLYGLLPFTEISIRIGSATSSSTHRPFRHRLRPYEHQEDNGIPLETLDWGFSPQEASATPMPPWSSFTDMFFFGDSYTANDFRPTGAQPNEAHPFGNHGMKEPKWVSFLTEVHNASVLRTYDFAVGGSTVDRKLVRPYLMGSTFGDELKNKFIPYYTRKSRKARWEPETTLFLMWFGVNDLVMPHLRDRKAARVSEIILSYRATAQKLYELGARNMIFLTIPPFELASDLSAEKKSTLRNEIMVFNTGIFAMRDTLRAAHGDLQLSVFDAYALWGSATEDPSAFAETESVIYTDKVCEPSGPVKHYEPHSAKCKEGLVREYLWYNIHGTFVVHNATAARIVAHCFAPGGRTGYCS